MLDPVRPWSIASRFYLFWFLALVLVFVQLCGLTGEAQVIPDSGGITWTAVSNCPRANAFGPQVYSDVQAEEPNAEEELVQLNTILVGCQQATPTTASPSYSGPSAIETILAALQTVLGLERQWVILHRGTEAISAAPPLRWRVWDPSTRQMRFVSSPASVVRRPLPIYAAPRPAPVSAPRSPVYVPAKALTISRAPLTLRRK